MENQNPWVTAGPKKPNNRNKWSSKQYYNNKNNNAWGKPNKASLSPPTRPMQQASTHELENKDPGTWSLEEPNNDWGAPHTDTNPDPWGTDPAPVWGEIETGVIPLPPDDWVYEDPNAPPELTSLNLAAMCNPVDDWYVKLKSPKNYYQRKRHQRIEDWVMKGTEEEQPPNLKGKGVRQVWKPFSSGNSFGAAVS